MIRLYLLLLAIQCVISKNCQQPFFSVESQNICVYLSSRVISLDNIETYCATEVYGAEPFTGRLTDDGLKDFRKALMDYIAIPNRVLIG
ncbi:hypothetical protein TNIN_251121 [Trichonephila inaurata madagascariensis]|uniref:Uncharacterized protein n=1 Tax=Trichonephila inaurata madagascariensis TaxID=2747483 RepID=A0A8X6WRI0_9ARAC|nr:hypothetical protein TNIN_251121 [Trichonephila inaurata madagascariensis]